MNLSALVSYESDENWAYYDQIKFFTYLWPWAWPLTYQRIGNWKVNIFVLVSYDSDENWACYDKNKFLTFLWPWPWPLTWLLPKSNQIGPWMMTNHPWKFHAIRSSTFWDLHDLDLDLWPDRSQNLINWSLDDHKSSLKISCNSAQ